MWLPFHRVMVGSALAMFPDLFLAPRMVTFVFGLATLATLTWLAHELFRDRRITNATALLGAVFMPRVVLSLAPLSDVPFGCVILAAMAALVRWMRTPTRARLVLASLVFALSETIRYEGWGFAASFAVVVLAHRWSAPERVSRTDVALCAIIVSAFPSLWMGIDILHSGTPLASVDKNGTPFADWLTVLRKNPLTEFLVINGLTMNVIGLLSLAAHARREPRIRSFLFVAAIPLLCVATILLFAKRAQSGPSWRMIVVWSLLLLPFTVEAVIRLRHQLPRFGRALTAVVFGGLCLLSLLATHRMYQQSRWAIPPITRGIGRDLNAVLATYPAGTRVLIDSSTYSYLNLLVSSQRPDLFIRNSAPERENDPSAIVSSDRPLPLAELERRNIRLLVFRTPALREILDRQTALRRLTDYGEWAVYEVMLTRSAESARVAG